MLKKNQYWILTVLAALGALLAVVNMAMYGQNRKIQAELNARAQYIQQGAQVEQLYRDLVKVIADLSVRNNDAELREILTKQGIPVSANPPAASAAPPSAPVPSAEPKKGGK